MNRRNPLQKMRDAVMLFAGLALMASLLGGCDKGQVVYVVVSATPTPTPWVVTVVVTPVPPAEAGTSPPVMATSTILPPTPAATQPAADTPVPTPVPPTATSTPVPPTAAPTSVPPTAAQAPSVIITLGPGKFGNPLWLEVVKGEYQLVSGATLRAGSAISVQEDWLTFPRGLGIDVTGGEITLRGATYPAGTKLIVNNQGNLVNR
jgi:hypothetical protein